MKVSAITVAKQHLNIKEGNLGKEVGQNTRRLWMGFVQEKLIHFTPRKSTLI